MEREYNKIIEITDLKDMLNKTRKIYGNNKAYKLKKDGKEFYYTHEEVRCMVDSFGTALIDLGLKNKRIAVIGENRFEWELAYLSIVCGTGTVVPFDKSLPENELESVIERSDVEAIVYSGKYQETLENIKRLGVGKLKHLINMDYEVHKDGVYSMYELLEKGKKLVEEGNKEFIDATIDPEAMSIMLFTSGTTSMSKIVALSHKNIVSNLMDLAMIHNIDSNDVLLSVLPLHHVFECTVGFLFSLYCGALTVFSTGMRHIVEDIRENHISVMANVPAVYERIFKIIRKELEKNGELEKVRADMEKYKDCSLEERRKHFDSLHQIIGGNVKLFISGAAALEPTIEEKFRLVGVNMVQGYGLTETSPVVGMGNYKEHRTGSIGKAVPSMQAKIENPDKDGMGELIVKGPTVMIEYYQNKKATNEALKDGWFHTGDLAKIDEDGYIFICGRKKSVIVLKNGKNIFPEEMENLVNKIEGVIESFIFGQKMSDDENDIKLRVKIVYDKEVVKNAYKVETEEEIFEVLHNKIKALNKTMPQYKAIRGLLISEKPLIKTSTNKIKRQANLDEIEKSNS